MKYLNKPVFYLEDNDFDLSGNLVNPNIPKNLPIVIMIQALFCPHCTTSKPAFQEFADDTVGQVMCCTIEGDGKRSGEQKLMSRIDKIDPKFRGFPGYVLYFDGKRVDKEIEGRNKEDLKNFVK